MEQISEGMILVERNCSKGDTSRARNTVELMCSKRYILKIGKYWRLAILDIFLKDDILVADMGEVPPALIEAPGLGG